MTQTIAYLEAVVGADITDFRRGMQEVRRDTGLFSDNFGGIAGALNQAGRSLTFAVTVPIMAAAAASVHLASEFDGAMRNINSIAQLPEGQFQSLKQQVIEFGIGTRSGAQAAAEALYEVYSAGITGSEAFDIMQHSVKTAEGGLADLSKTTNALTATMLAFRNQGLTIEDASNIWSRMVQLGVGSLEDFLQNSQKVLPAASALGITFEDVGINAAFLSQQGGGASKAMTALGMLMSNLLKPNLTLAAAYKELGVATGQELITKFGSLEDAIKAIRDTTESDVDFAKMFSKTGLEAVLAITNNWDALQDTIVQFRNNLDNATETAWQQQMESFPALLDRFKAAVEGLGIVIGTILLPVLTPIIEGFVNLAKHAAALDPRILQVAVAIALAVAAAGPLLWVLGSLLSPVGLLITGVGLLSTAFSTNFMGIRDTVTNAASQILGDLQPLKDGVATFMSTLFDTTDTVSVGVIGANVEVSNGMGLGDRLSAAVTASWPMISTALSGIWTNITTWITTVGVPLIDGVGGDVMDGIAGIFDTSTSDFSGGGGLYNTIRDLFSTDLDKVGADVGGWIEGIAPDTTSGFTRMLNQIGTWLKAEGIPTLSRTIGLLFGNLIAGIPALIISVATGLAGADTSGAGEIGTIILDPLMQGIKDGFSDMANSTGLIDTITLFVNNVKALIDVGLQNLGLNVSSAFTELGRTIRTAVNTFMLNIFGVSAGLLAQIPDALFPGGAQAKEGLVTAFSAITQDIAKSLHIDEFLRTIETEMDTAIQGGTLMLDPSRWNYGVYDFSIDSNNINAETIAAGMDAMGVSQLMVMVNSAMEQAMAGSDTGLANMEVLLPVAIQAGFSAADISANIGPEFIDEMQYVIENALLDQTLTNDAQNAYYQFLQNIMGSTGGAVPALSGDDLMADTFGKGAMGGPGGLAGGLKAQVESTFKALSADTSIKANIPVKPATDADIQTAVSGTVSKITQQAAAKGASMQEAGATMMKSLANGVKTNATTAFAAGGEADIAMPIQTMLTAVQTSFTTVFSPGGMIIAMFLLFRSTLMVGFQQLGSMFTNAGLMAFQMRSMIVGAFGGIAGLLASAVGAMLNSLGSLQYGFANVANSARSAANAIAEAVRAASTPIPAPGRTPGHASGGLGSGWSMVGERGPELVNLGARSAVVSSSTIKSAIQGGGGSSGGNTIVVQGVTDVDKMIYELRRRGIVLGRA